MNDTFKLQNWALKEAHRTMNKQIEFNTETLIRYHEKRDRERGWGSGVWEGLTDTGWDDQGSRRGHGQGSGHGSVSLLHTACLPLHEYIVVIHVGR